MPHRDATLDQETADLIDHAGPLAHKARGDAMESEQVHLFRRLDRHKVHGRPLHRGPQSRRWARPGHPIKRYYAYHSIISLARARMLGGTSRPIALPSSSECLVLRYIGVMQSAATCKKATGYLLVCQLHYIDAEERLS